MKEVEAKYRIDCNRLGRIKTKIEGMGARLVSTRIEEDVYFEHPCRSMLERDEAIRLRRVEDGGSTRLILTYKGPRSGGLAKSREEVEARVDDTIILILDRLGFKPVVTVSKRRTIYDLGDLLFFVDEVKGLGCFVEIESRSGDPDAIIKAGETIGLDRGSIVDLTYVEMLIGR